MVNVVMPKLFVIIVMLTVCFPRQLFAGMSVFGFFKGHGLFKQTICIFLHNCGMLNLTSVYLVDANVLLSNTHGSLRYDTLDVD